MKKMIVLSLVLMGAFDVRGMEDSSSTKKTEEGEVKELVEKWKPLSFDVGDLDGGKSEKVINKLGEAHEKFNCAFTPQEHLSQKYNFTRIFRKIGMGSLRDGYRAVVRGHSTAAIKDFQNDGEGRKLFKKGTKSMCQPNEIAFESDWSPLKYVKTEEGEKEITLEHFVRSLKFDVDTKEDGTPLEGKNIKSGAFYSVAGKKVTLGWFGLAPLKGGIEGRNTFFNKEGGPRTHRSDRSWGEGIAEMGGLFDCNTTGLLCGKADNFFRRLKGCSMRSLYSRGCIKEAINSDWVKEIVTVGGKIDEITLKSQDRRALPKAKAKIAHQVIWTFVLAELLERHDARRYRNNVVRGLSAALEEKKESTLNQVFAFLKAVENELLLGEAETQEKGAAKVSETLSPRKLKIKREISLAFEDAYKKFVPVVSAEK